MSPLICHVQASRQAQQQRPSSSLGAVFPGKSPELSRWILSPDEVISQLDMWLCGAKVEYDDEGKAKIKFDTKNQRLNATGRRLALTPLLALLNKNVVLSDLEERQIGLMTEDYHVKLAETLLKDWRTVGVTSPRELPELIDYMSANVFTALNRAKKGAAMSQLNQLHMIQESVTHSGKESGGSKWKIFG